jgi:Flp pilus assembly protein TadG
VLYIGSVERGNLLTMCRRASQVASTAADLTAQVKTVSTSDLSDMTSAASSFMIPYSTNPLKIVISSFVADQNNIGKVAWSYGSKGGARATGSVYPTPTGLTEPGSSVIVAEVTYGFTPLVNMPQFFSPGSFDIKRTFYARPRKSLTVTKKN